ncbi:hypothetical protein [Mycoplasmopsis gallopavonis]|uniref:Uncharacterized protein n=1 Tax=Mycoplasmopsis gallopavonis TaxID=76629 RepID=A0A449B095_9BACT|nr:hypothetical protein [Mycoplasmopsis gallopavonis]RIV16844.1 hypothetical protein D1113_00685 [Mycoplasmopsis gallopavonis]VEU73148.1 Uncharacterised protein [Mycoplasmopsis gallopavonis]
MHLLLTQNFIWEVAISEYCGLLFLILISFVSTYLAKRKIKIKLAFSIIYSLGILGSSLLSLSILKMLFFVSKSPMLSYNELVPIINPMGTLLFLCVELIEFISLNQASKILALNVLILLLVHLFAALSAFILAFFFLKRKPEYKDLFIGTNSLSKKVISYQFCFIFIFILLVFLIEYKLNFKVSLQNVLFKEMLSALACFLTLAWISLLGQFNYPTNLYVAFATFLLAIWQRKTRLVTNLVQMQITIIFYCTNSLLISLFYLI